MEIKKCKDGDRLCTECGASMKSEFSEIDKLLETTYTDQTFELLFGRTNSRIQIILCKECMKELCLLTNGIYQRENK